MRVFERRIRAVCYRLLDDARDVDEAVQDTFVQAWRNLERFRGDAAPYTWLYRIAVNEALQRRRKTLPTTELQETLVSGGEDVFAAADARSFLVERLRALPDDYRAAIVLRESRGSRTRRSPRRSRSRSPRRRAGSTAAACSCAPSSSNGSARNRAADAQPARSASARSPSVSPLASGRSKKSG